MSDSGGVQLANGILSFHEASAALTISCVQNKCILAVYCECMRLFLQFVCVCVCVSLQYATIVSPGGK